MNLVCIPSSRFISPPLLLTEDARNLFTSLGARLSREPSETRNVLDGLWFDQAEIVRAFVRFSLISTKRETLFPWRGWDRNNFLEVHLITESSIWDKKLVWSEPYQSPPESQEPWRLSDARYPIVALTTRFISRHCKKELHFAKFTVADSTMKSWKLFLESLVCRLLISRVNSHNSVLRCLRLCHSW